MFKNVVLPLAVVAIAAAVSLAIISSRPELPRRESIEVVPLVEVVTVQPGPVAVTIESRGIVTPRRSIDLVSEVSGRVDWVDSGFLQGEAVSEGQLLLRIDPIDYEVALSTAEASLASAELALAEVKALVKKAAIAEAQAGVTAARDRLRQAKVDLANTEIRAPFNAVVDIKQVDVGQYVTAGSSLMKLLSTDVAEVRLPLLASDVPYVDYGQYDDGTWPQIMLTASFGNIKHSWRARLARLERRVDEETRVFFVVAQVDEPYSRSLHSHILALGLFVEASFAGIAIDDAVKIPRSALHQSSYVYLVENGSLQRREVTLRRRESDSVIVSGLEAGDLLVLTRLDLMVDGMPVRMLD
ncbi:efflux RND transporter periplasmic adaptor subunit [Seongchinamella unica]|uniref:efflux RND transporter periplasmic adaptor subunit n=1 Tax=Seongchinamella unica TaxID=2547392 RepID=UPI0014046CB2|nr:efflux RND transporter periplasmic adaptor subunit [Seongchinamella unica]